MGNRQNPDFAEMSSKVPSGNHLAKSPEESSQHPKKSCAGQVAVEAARDGSNSAYKFNAFENQCYGAAIGCR